MTGRNTVMTPPLTKLILLDFDNVLNDNAYIRATLEMFPGAKTFSLALGRAMLDPVRVARAQRICDATGAGILLVTGWRQWTGWENLAELLRDHGLTAPVVGAVGGVKMSADLRASASREWLGDHREVTRYVVLDDGLHHWRYGDWEPVMVAPKDGIEEEHVARAIEILNRA